MINDTTKNDNKPQLRPKCPNFSSGPCAKHPEWSINDINRESLGRSHRSKIGKYRLKKLIDETYEILNIPQNYKIAIVPASDTGAFEMALWNVIGKCGVDVYAWESFGLNWANTIKNILGITDLNISTAEYGELPLLNHDINRDCVFTYNGTTSGVKIPNTDWINTNRNALTICDATSAVFVENFDWEKLDITTWSWQKALGGEGGHGMIVLSPRAIKRLEIFTSDRAIPSIFTITKNNKLIDGIFNGATINTPSMMCVEDTLETYNWVKSIGGRQDLQKRSYKNYKVIEEWVNTTPWVNFLAKIPEQRSTTSVCLTIDNAEIVPKITATLDEEGVAYDINSYRNSPTGLRIWCGPTVENKDIINLLPWINWAYKKHSI